MSGRIGFVGCFSTMLSMIDLHPAEPLHGAERRAYNLVRKQCLRPVPCASISPQAFPGADRSLNYQALQYAAVNVTEKMGQ